jgi:hypothetical protein
VHFYFVFQPNEPGDRVTWKKCTFNGFIAIYFAQLSKITVEREYTWFITVFQSKTKAMFDYI